MGFEGKLLVPSAAAVRELQLRPRQEALAASVDAVETAGRQAEAARASAGGAQEARQYHRTLEEAADGADPEPHH